MTERPSVRIWFTDFWHDQTEESIYLNPCYILLSQRYSLVLDRQSPDLLVYSCFGVRFRKYSCPRIFWLGESMHPDLAECDFAISFDTDLPDRNHYYPLCFYVPYMSTLEREFARRDAARAFADKSRFCNFIYANKSCPERNHFFEVLSALKSVDAPGTLYNNMDASGQLSDRAAADFYSSKVTFTRQYKFSIVFENALQPGYTTEKIRSAFEAHSVPIYWGNPDIADLFNTAALINCHHYTSLEEAAQAVMTIDADDALYQRYLQASPFIDGKAPPCAKTDRVLDAIERFLASPPAKPAATTRHSRLLHYSPKQVAAHITRRRRSSPNKSSPQLAK